MFRRVCTLVFLISAASTLAVAADKPTKGLRYPSLTPDGKSVVFGYRGDIWIAPADGKGRAQRLTIHEDQETLCRVSPDGKQIAFSSRRAGGYDLYVMPITGGEPKQITFHSATEIMCDWSPDGKKILFMANTDANMGALDLYEADLENGGTPRRITFDGGREGTYSKDGTRIAYVRGSITIYQDNYEGSGNYDIHVVDAKGGTPQRLTDTKGNERYPCFSEDGKTLWFVTEEKGVANFYSMPVAGGKRTQVTSYKIDDVNRPDLGWDYKTVVFEIVGQLYWTDLTKPTAKPTPIPLSIKSDVRNSGVELRTISAGGEHVHLSADGRQAAFSLRGDVWIMPAGGGNARRLTSGAEKDEWPRFSPDGKSIAYFSNKRGTEDIFLLDLGSGRTRPLTTHRAGDFFHNWSPDGKRLVFCSERSGNREIWLLEIDSGQLTQLTKHPAADDDPTFSPDGKKIAFDSGRDGQQAIYVMNVDGSKVRRVTGGAGFFQVPCFSPDGKHLVYESFNPTNGRSGGLFVVSTRGGPSMQISRDGQGACWSLRGDYIYFGATRAPGGQGIYRVRAPDGVVAGERVPFIGRIEVDRRKELETLFDEAWNALRAGFYDPKMHGVDWNAMKRKYRDWAIDAENKDAFHGVIRQMLAELNASHLGISGGQRGSSVAPKPKETGYLGVDFDQKPLEDGARKVVRVVAGSPADKAGLRIGDVVTRIGRTKLKAKTNLHKVMAGTVAKSTPVTFRPRSEAGLGTERTIGVSPVNWQGVLQLKQKEWVQTCARRVKEASKGALAYIHLDSMNPPNLQRFEQAVQRWNRSKKVKGMVLDVRFNGGGNIHQQLMSILIAQPLAEVQRRGGPKTVQPALYWDKPVVLLINERSFSDAEVFPFMFKAAKVGKVVGVPTPGGVIGTRDITLSDGSRFRVPGTGFKGMSGENLEGLGVQPDLLVEMTVEDRLAGKDPQLAKAIEIVTAEVEERKKAAAAEKKPEEKKKEEEKKAPAPKQPEPKPAVTASAENTLADVRVGEWVRYKASDPGNGAETILKLTVTRVANGAVQLEKEVEQGAGGIPIPEKVQQGKVIELLKRFGQVLGHSVLPGRVKDTDTDILVARVLWPDGSQLRCHFTNAIPCYGLWKVEINKQVVLEAVEWGYEPPAAVKTPEGGKVPAQPEGGGQSKAAKLPGHPMHDAVEGEWAKFRQVLPNSQEVEMTIRVIEVSDDEVVLEQEIALGERTMKTPPVRREKKKELTGPDGTDVTYSKETITVAGKPLECIVLTATNDAGIELKLFYSPTIPVTGLVRLDRDGETVREILEWGKEGE